LAVSLIVDALLIRLLQNIFFQQKKTMQTNNMVIIGRISVIWSVLWFVKIAANVLKPFDLEAIEVKSFNCVQQFNQRTTVELCSFAPLLKALLLSGF